MRSIRSILYFPEELKNQFFDISLNKNRIVLFVLAIAGIFIQGFNIIRVLVLSNAKLSTLNNRIYFSFYLFLFIISILYLLNQICIKNKILCYYIDSVCISIFMFWNVGLTIYDTYSAGIIKTSVSIICLMVFGALFLHRPYFMLLNLLTSYLLLVISTLRFQTAGSLINITIAVILSGVMAINRYLNTISDLKQKQNIADINKVLKAEEDKFRLTCEQYDMLLKYTQDILFVWDLEKDLIKFSDNWHDIFGFPVVIQKFTKWLSENSIIGEKKSKDMEKLRKHLQAGQIHKEEEILIKSVSGKESWYKMHVLNQFDYSGFPRFGVGILNDITAQKEIIIELEHEVQKDPLTKTLNKTAVEMRINKRLKKFNGNNKAALLLIDLDNFKNINDEFGHPCGDYVLIECAFILKNTFNKDAEIGRIGGDEFIVFIEDITDKMLHETCDLIIKKMQEICWKGTRVNVNCSIGATILTEDVNEYAQLYYEADDAMYMAKKAGKGKFYIHHKTKKINDKAIIN